MDGGRRKVLIKAASVFFLFRFVFCLFVGNLMENEIETSIV